MPPRARAPRRATPASAPRRPTAITSLQSQGVKRHRNWVIYGPSGVGKSVLAGTAPNALFLAADPNGTESARELGSTADEVPVDTWQQFSDYVDWIVRGDGATAYEYIIVDTVDEVEERCWEAQLVSEDLKRASKYQPNKGDYPVVWRKLREELNRLNRAPVNVIYLAHMMHIDREDEEGDTVTLAMPEMGSRKRGDLSSWFCAQAGLVGYMRTVDQEGGGTERQLMTATTSRYIAKDRTTKMGAGIVDPTIPGMLARIAGGTPPTSRRTRRRAA